jgi:hypothetical protein
VAQADQVLGVLALGLITDTGLANFVGPETLGTEAVDYLNCWNERVTLTARFMSLFCQHAWCVVTDLVIAQGEL